MHPTNIENAHKILIKIFDENLIYEITRLSLEEIRAESEKLK